MFTREIIEIDDPAWPEMGFKQMTIELKPEHLRIIQAEIASGHFRDPGEVLDHALAALQEKGHKGEARVPRKNLAQFLMESPLAGAELNLERQNDYGRTIEL